MSFKTLRVLERETEDILSQIADIEAENLETDACITSAEAIMLVDLRNRILESIVKEWKSDDSDNKTQNNLDSSLWDQLDQLYNMLLSTHNDKVLDAHFENIVPIPSNLVIPDRYRRQRALIFILASDKSLNDNNKITLYKAIQSQIASPMQSKSKHVYYKYLLDQWCQNELVFTALISSVFSPTPFTPRNGTALFSKIELAIKLLVMGLKVSEVRFNTKMLDYLIDYLKSYAFNVKNNLYTTKLMPIFYSLLSTLGHYSIKLNQLCSFYDIIKIFDTLLFSYCFKFIDDVLVFEYSDFIKSLPVPSRIYIIQNLLTISLGVTQYDVISTRTNLTVKFIKFDFLFKCLNLVNLLIKDEEDAQFVNYLSYIYVLLLNPPNVDLNHSIEIYFINFIMNISQKNANKVPSELVKILVFNTMLYPELFTLENLNEFSRTYKGELSKDLQNLISYKFKHQKEPRDSQWTDQIILLLEPFTLVYQLCFTMLTTKSIMTFGNLIHLVIKLKFRECTINILETFKSYNMDWFDEHKFETIMIQLDTAHSLDDDSIDTEVVEPPLYLEYTENTAFQYISYLLKHKDTKLLDKDDLILFDMFKFEKNKFIRSSLETIFTSFKMSELFIKVLINKLGASDSLSLIVLKDQKLLDSIKNSENKWRVMKSCFSKVPNTRTFNCLSILSLILNEEIILSEQPKSFSDCFSYVISMFYTRDHDKESKLEFWDYYSLFALDENNKIESESLEAIFETFQEFQYRKCESYFNGAGQRIILDNKELINNHRRNVKKKSPKKYDEVITNNCDLQVTNSSGAIELWPVTIKIYPSGTKIDVPDTDTDLKNKLFDSERKLWFQRKKYIGVSSTKINGDKEIFESYDYYQRILVFDLFRGIFEGQKNTGVLIASIFSIDCNFTLETPQNINDLLTSKISIDKHTTTFQLLLLIEFSAIFIRRGINVLYWDTVLQKLKSSREAVLSLAAEDVLSLLNFHNKKR